MTTANRPSELLPQAHAHHGGKPLDPTDSFFHRHIGPSDGEIEQMLATIGYGSLDDMVRATVPESILLDRPLNLGKPRGEFELLGELKQMMRQNKVHRSCLGMGYADTITPPVILRNILENPGWYTQYTPYQAEIAQGRLEALLNFQTMVTDLTAMEISNASLLDEATAAAEAMSMCFAILNHKRARFLVDDRCHPQTIAVCQTRAEGLGIELVLGDPARASIDDSYCGVLIQYPATDGELVDPTAAIERAHAAGAQAVVACDLLALALVKAPGELGADIAIGSAQRFGVPMGFGGPHAAFLATSEKHVRKMPGRIIGVSKDMQGDRALRMAIQTREQHIKRDRATSNICTAQALLAIIAGMYGVYHGPDGIRAIAERVHRAAGVLAAGLRDLGHEVLTTAHFDTIRVRVNGDAATVYKAAIDREINLRDFGDGTLGIALDETVDRRLLNDLFASFGGTIDLDALESRVGSTIPDALARTSEYLTHEIFNRYDSETELLRYIFELQERDLSLAHSMIPLGSCTMKLNATTEMIPVTWPELGRLHPFAPLDQANGYLEMFTQLEDWLSEITGFPAVSLQPNAGSQGEYTGLMVIRAYHHANGEAHRDVCLVPTSAHGTNPASAVIAGMRVVTVNCDESGAIDADDLRKKAEQHSQNLAALMVTYPSTFGVFDQNIQDICAIVHEHGGQVYLDGANMNALVGLCRPGDFGADVCHLNLHKTFCIPHGGGGPGMGPIGVAEHLKPFLPTHPLADPQRSRRVGNTPMGPVSAAPWGSPSILAISWTYIAMMGAHGLKAATEVAILSANYMAKRLEDSYPILYRGKNGRCAHEFIVDCRAFDDSAGIKIDDIAKRLIDYGFHAPTMAWPVPGTLMIEPTESEPKDELDRFCDAMIAIRKEIAQVEAGSAEQGNNLLTNAPHTIKVLTADAWNRPYTRHEAAWPAPWLIRRKFWPAVGRVDNPYGDRNLVCTCPPVEEYAGA